ncbi:MAG: CRISPR-associated protein [Selenomonadaceae bacterium]|nr:CRISPR-associated protein [Selenomonadaceae bacterium]
MSKTFINHTNHPSDKWSDAQRSAAEAYGEIIDVPFPPIPSSATHDQVLELVEQYLNEILSREPAAVLCQGEFNYTFAMVERLKQLGITTLAACSERVTSEVVQGDCTTRVSHFRFVQFRQY